MMKHKWKDRHIQSEETYTYCRVCGLMQNPKNINKDCKGNPGLRPLEPMMTWKPACPGSYKHTDCPDYDACPQTDFSHCFEPAGPEKGA